VYEVDTSEGIDAERQASNHALAVTLGSDRLLTFRSLVSEAHKEIRSASLPKLFLEVALVRLAGVSPSPHHAVRAAAVSPPPRQPQKASTQAVAAPKPAEPKSVAPKPFGKRAAPPSGDVSEMSEVWSQVVANIKHRFASAGAILDYTHVSRVSEKAITIGVQNQLQYDRLTNKDDILKVIQAEFAEIAGESGWNLSYELDAAERADQEEPSAVQLPAEGEALARLVEDVFKVQSE
jgi:DNA polymerase III gamma/tau subunit